MGQDGEDPDQRCSHPLEGDAPPVVLQPGRRVVPEALEQPPVALPAAPGLHQDQPPGQHHRQDRRHRHHRSDGTEVSGRDIGEAGDAVLQGNPGTVGGEADGVVPAAEQEEVEQLVVREAVAELAPQVIVDVGPVVEGVDGPDQQRLPGLRPSSDRRRRRGSAR